MDDYDNLWLEIAPEACDFKCRFDSVAIHSIFFSLSERLLFVLAVLARFKLLKLVSFWAQHYTNNQLI